MWSEYPLGVAVLFLIAVASGILLPYPKARRTAKWLLLPLMAVAFGSALRGLAVIAAWEWTFTIKDAIGGDPVLPYLITVMNGLGLLLLLLPITTFSFGGSAILCEAVKFDGLWRTESHHWRLMQQVCQWWGAKVPADGSLCGVSWRIGLALALAPGWVCLVLGVNILVQTTRTVIWGEVPFWNLSWAWCYDVVFLGKRPRPLRLGGLTISPLLLALASSAVAICWLNWQQGWQPPLWLMCLVITAVVLLLAWVISDTYLKLMARHRWKRTPATHSSGGILLGGPTADLVVQRTATLLESERAHQIGQGITRRRDSVMNMVVAAHDAACPVLTSPLSKS